MRKILPWISINNTIVPQEKAVIPVLDDGFMYGYGFFTTLKVRERIPLFLEKHTERLKKSAPRVGMQHIESLNLESSVQQVIEKNEMIEGAIRITVTKGISDKPTIVIHATTIDTQIHTVPVITVVDERDVYKTVKMTYRVPHILAMQKAQEQGAQDALFTLDTMLIESTYASLYIYTPEGNILTPPIAGKALDSISRKVLLEQLPIQEQEVPEDTEQPMVLVSSLSMRIVEKINGKPIQQDAEFVLKMQNALESAEMHYITARNTPT